MAYERQNFVEKQVLKASDMNRIEDALCQFANPNLLINGDFKINQRGETTYKSASDSIGNATKLYSVDRWRIGGKTGLTLTVNDGSITLTNTSTNTIYLMQMFEKTLKLNDYTLSANVLEVSGDVKLYLEGVTNKLAVTKGYVTHTTNGTPQGVTLGLYGNSSITLEYIKLEQGKLATPFVPRLYTEELALCQRYYYKQPSGNAYCIYGYQNVDNNVVVTNLTVPTTMRGTPKVSYSAFGLYGNGKSLTVSKIAVVELFNNNVQFQISTSTFGANQVVLGRISGLEIDDEIY